MTRASRDAAAILWKHWRESTRIDALPPSCRPADRAEGYAIQAEVARLSGLRVAGWKIAATSVDGQRHIGVDGPLAGRLLAERLLAPGATVPMHGNAMRVAEAEFAFRLRTGLPSRELPYSVDEVVDAVATLHPAIEIPDSRYIDFAQAGGPQLIADTACACWALIGPAAHVNWRARDLACHEVSAYRNDTRAVVGSGANVLGDPRLALTWLANELARYGQGLRPDDVVITGTCVKPVPIAPGDRVRMDFGDVGTIDARLGEALATTLGP
jgi:2-keto-4-pentenoate hydratase